MFSLFEKIKNEEIYVIAEMSANHGGKLENALEIVRQAKKAGADCLKIQTYTADSLTIDCDNDYFKVKGGLWDGYKLYDLYKEAETPYEWHEDIKKECEKCGIDFLSTPFSNKDVDFLESMGVEAYKIASFELVDIPFIEYVASKGKPMIISTGMGTVAEIEDAIEACYKAGNNRIILLKCCSEYPARWEDMRLANIKDMKQRFKLPIGLSDHSEGTLAATCAVALGAEVIEKHVKLDNVNSPDSDFSMSLEGFSKMVIDVRNANKLVGKPAYSLSSYEEESIVFRRSIFAIEDILVGEVFSEKNISVIRPGYGMMPKYYNKLIGEKSTRRYKRGEPIEEFDYSKMF